MSLKKGKGQASATRYRAAPSSSEAGTCTEHCSVFEMRTKSLNQQANACAETGTYKHSSHERNIPDKSIGNLAFARASFYSPNRLSLLNASLRSSGPSLAGLRSRHLAFLLPFFFAVPALPLPSLRRHACPPRCSQASLRADGFASSAPAQRARVPPAVRLQRFFCHPPC